MISKREFNKIYLNCRRGILELDIILLIFLKHDLLNFNNNFIDNFKNLLKESDQKLYYLLINKKFEKKYENIIYKIKASVKHHKKII